ncbi:Hypothetical predicted protein [Pelobates cultripes]|uniref:Uncharacterized protein n=1 Tax=Pelobates cultripes TaxID=61616 RepID=A0AAD1RRH3_PELCU|nr:Hypothetical predicted protein [Pelobates cultripes]
MQSPTLELLPKALPRQLQYPVVPQRDLPSRSGKGPKRSQRPGPHTKTLITLHCTYRQPTVEWRGKSTKTGEGPTKRRAPTDFCPCQGTPSIMDITGDEPPQWLPAHESSQAHKKKAPKAHAERCKASNRGRPRALSDYKSPTGCYSPFCRYETGPTTLPSTAMLRCAPASDPGPEWA